MDESIITRKEKLPVTTYTSQQDWEYVENIILEQIDVTEPKKSQTAHSEAIYQNVLDALDADDPRDKTLQELIESQHDGVISIIESEM